MDSLIPFLVIGFVIFRWIKKAGDFTKRMQQDGTSVRPQDVQGIIQQAFSSRTGSSTTPTPIPRKFVTDEQPDGLFGEDKWRRQLFLVSFTIGLVYLVYLLVI